MVLAIITGELWASITEAFFTMPTNTKSKAEKAAIKRRQRERIRNGEMSPAEAVLHRDLLAELAEEQSGTRETKAIAKLTKRSLGRPTNLSTRIAARILNYVLEGMPPSRAAQAVGIMPATLVTWRKKAAEGLKVAEAEYEKALLEHSTVDGDDSTEADEKPEDSEDGLKKGRNQAVSELSFLDFIPSHLRLYVHLEIALSTAEARAEMRLLRKVARGGRDWKANMTILERRFSETWAKQEKKTHVIEGDSEKPVVITYESDEERQRRVAAILGRAGVLESTADEIPLDPEDVTGLPEESDTVE